MERNAANNCQESGQDARSTPSHGSSQYLHGVHLRSTYSSVAMQHIPWFIRAFGEAIELPSTLKRNDAVLHPMNMEYGTLWMSLTFHSHCNLLRVMGIVKPVDAEQIAGKYRPRSGQQGRVKNHTADLKSALP